ncbi:MAG: hypothetical protein AAGI66_06140 [Cyanobacteria bacterium P01_H01_bin.74]
MLAKNFSVSIKSQSNPFADLSHLISESLTVQYINNKSVRSQAAEKNQAWAIWPSPPTTDLLGQNRVTTLQYNVGPEIDYYQSNSNTLFPSDNFLISTSDNSRTGVTHTVFDSNGIHQHHMNTRVSHGSNCQCCCCCHYDETSDDGSGSGIDTSGTGTPSWLAGIINPGTGNYFDIYNTPPLDISSINDPAIASMFDWTFGIAATAAAAAAGVDPGSGGSGGGRYYVTNGLAYERTDDNIIVFGVRDSGFRDSYQWSDDDAEDAHAEAKQKTVKEVILMWADMADREGTVVHLHLNEIREQRGEANNLTTADRHALDTMIYFMSEEIGSSSMVDTLLDNYGDENLDPTDNIITAHTIARMGAELGLSKEFLQANLGYIDGLMDHINTNYAVWVEQSQHNDGDDPGDGGDSGDVGDGGGGGDSGGVGNGAAKPPFHTTTYYEDSGNEYIIEGIGTDDKDWTNNTTEQNDRYLEWLEVLSPHLQHMVIKDDPDDPRAISSRGVIRTSSIEAYLRGEVDGVDAPEGEDAVAVTLLYNELLRLKGGVDRSEGSFIIQYLDRRGSWQDEKSGHKYGNGRIAVAEFADLLFDHFSQYGYGGDYSRDDYVREFNIATYDNEESRLNDEPNP